MDAKIQKNKVWQLSTSLYTFTMRLNCCFIYFFLDWTSDQNFFTLWPELLRSDSLHPFHFWHIELMDLTQSSP